jgi:hypothetical protein
MKPWRHVQRVVHMAVCWRQPANVYPQPASDGCAHSVEVERLNVDGAGGDDFLGKGLQRGLVTLGQRGGQGSRVKQPLRPVGRCQM